MAPGNERRGRTERGHDTNGRKVEGCWQGTSKSDAFRKEDDAETDVAIAQQGSRGFSPRGREGQTSRDTDAGTPETATHPAEGGFTGQSDGGHSHACCARASASAGSPALASPPRACRLATALAATAGSTLGQARSGDGSRGSAAPLPGEHASATPRRRHSPPPRAREETPPQEKAPPPPS